ncbi:hypothetical protein K7432_002334 [Basidiobolus ranarum]|uniref:DSBA-like thioredoxin domain-containing protein n=1 Tax=Basidiobolus ranarum TaxID=34480 RepID=A0ABR2W8V1_9FUNG
MAIGEIAANCRTNQSIVPKRAALITSYRHHLHTASSTTKRYQHKLVLKPVFLFNLLQHWKQTAPIANEAKRKWIIKDAYRNSSVNKIPFKYPVTHPFNSVYALRASVPSVVGKRQGELVEALFDSIWNPKSKFIEVTNKTHLKAFLEEKGISLTEEGEEEAKQELENNIREAKELGVFGVPTMVVDNQVFWGCDQLPYVLETLQGKDPLNDQEINDKCKETLDSLKSLL